MAAARWCQGAFELICALKNRGWRLEGEEKKELTERRIGQRRVVIVRMNPRAAVEISGVPRQDYVEVNAKRTRTGSGALGEKRFGEPAVNKSMMVGLNPLVR
jgi:hypothetical protein